jgi:hypothetical protein
MAAQPTPAHPATMLAETRASDTAPDSPLPEPLFRTKRLLARPMHPQDAESSQRACAPASITKYMYVSPPGSLALSCQKEWLDEGVEWNETAMLKSRARSLAFPHPYALEHAHTWIAMNKDTPYSTSPLSSRLPSSPTYPYSTKHAHTTQPP